MNTGLNDFEIDLHFPSGVYRVKKPEFLPTLRPVFREYVEEVSRKNKINELYPGVMTNFISEDSRVAPFKQYIDHVSWEILDSQGYDMSTFITDSSEMWGQHHQYSSSMEQHIHGLGTQLCGFYFIDTPSDSSKAFFHDPRSAKVYAGLPEKYSETLTLAHNMVYYSPEPGDLIITNSWLAHSFTRNASKNHFNFIHINIRVLNSPLQTCPTNSGPIIV